MRRRNRVLMIVLGGVLVTFLATLPWQQRQWADAARLRAELVTQQARERQLRQSRESRVSAEDALRASPDDPAARLAAAAVRIRDRDVPGAVALLRSVDSAAVSAQTADTAAGLYEQIGYVDRAVVLAREGVRLNPHSPAALLRLGVLDLQVGWQRPGLALLHRAAARDPASAEIHVALALADDQSGLLTDAARELAIARRLRPTDWHIASLTADNLSGRHQDTAALGALDEAQRLAPTEPKILAQRAAILLAQEQAAGAAASVAPAAAAARQCLALDPNNVSAHDTLARAYREEGEGTLARREWERAYVLQPDYSGLRYGLGRLLVAQGERVRGLGLIAEAQKQQRDDAEWDRLVLQAGSAPENTSFHRQLAQWCMAHGRFSRAIFEWQEILSRLPQDVEARQGLQSALTQRT